MRDEIETFRTNNVQPLGVNPAGVDSHASYARKLGLPFPLLSDPDRKAHDAYGAWGDRPGRGEGVIRSTFLVDEKGKIKKAWYGVKPDGHAGEVLDALNS